eukprot:NODE_15021_length_1072_cov_4.788360.p6 GENE.NODE_15021_length_1072_cov_4.788360~~NODE_15021_length_1072_cov_4.788360.p6  ORF type:complete len:56 (-),score=9.90 NODE_15021_length_1072_cov_4.788360:779-946(-)
MGLVTMVLPLACWLRRQHILRMRFAPEDNIDGFVKEVIVLSTRKNVLHGSRIARV